jgi:hypothetical protein
MPFFIFRCFQRPAPSSFEADRGEGLPERRQKKAFPICVRSGPCGPHSLLFYGAAETDIKLGRPHLGRKLDRQKTPEAVCEKLRAWPLYLEVLHDLRVQDLAVGEHVISNKRNRPSISNQNETGSSSYDLR